MSLCRLLLSLACISTLLQDILTENIEIKGIAKGDRVIYDLQSKGGNRWPLFDSLQKDGFKPYFKPDSVRCLPKQAEQGDFELLDYYKHGFNNDKMLIQFKNGTITMVNSIEYIGAPVLNGTFKTLDIGSKLIYSFIYCFGGFGNLTYRLYYTKINSKEVRFFDAFTGKDEVSKWQPNTDITGAKATLIEGKFRESFLVMLAQPGDTTSTSTDTFRVVHLIEPTNYGDEFVERAFELTPGLAAANLSAEVSLSFMAVIVEKIIYNSSTNSHSNLVFGGVSQKVSEAAKTILYSCIISNTDETIMACTTLFDRKLTEGESLLNIRTTSENQNPVNFNVKLFKKAETGNCTINQISYQSLVSLKSLYPLDFQRPSFKQSEMSEFNFCPNCTVIHEKAFSEGLVIQTGVGESTLNYIMMNFFTVSPYITPSVFLLPNSYRQLMRARSWNKGIDLAVLDDSYCVQQFAYGSIHYIDIDTSIYANNSAITVWYYKRLGNTVMPYNDTIVLNYTGGNMHLTTNAKSLKAYARIDSSFQIDSDPDAVSGYYVAGPDIKFDGGKTPAYAKINANKMLFFHVSSEQYREIQSTNILATTDKVVDLQNMHAYTSCNYEIAREIGVVCKTEFDIQLKQTNPVAVSFFRHMTLMVLASNDDGTLSTVAVVDHAAKTYKEYDLPSGARNHALQTFNGYVVVVYVNKEGYLESTHFHLKEEGTKTSCYNLNDVIKITSLIDGESREFSVITKSALVDYSIRYTYNSSNPRETILDGSNKIKLNPYPGLKFTSSCSLKNKDGGNNISVIIDNDRMYMRRSFKGAFPTIGISFNAPLENVICGPTGIYFKHNNNLVKIPTDGSIEDLIADRYARRYLYSVTGTVELIYADQSGEYALVNEGHAKSVILLNPKGTSFILASIPDRVGLEYQSATDAIYLPLDLEILPSEVETPVNLPNMGNYTYANGRINFRIEVDSSKKSTGGHLWGFDDSKNPSIIVQNRFTYMNDVTYDENFQVVDVAVKKEVTAYLVKNLQSSNYSLVLKGDGIDAKLMVVSDMALQANPRIYSMNYYVRDFEPVIKVNVQYHGTTSCAKVLIAEFKNGQFQTKEKDFFVMDRRYERIAIAENVTFHTRMSINEAIPKLSLTADYPSRWWPCQSSLYRIDGRNVEHFDLIAIGQYPVLAVKYIGKIELNLFTIDSQDINATLVNATIQLDLLKDNKLQKIKCAPSGNWMSFSCIFYGFKITRVEIRFEADRKSATIMKMVDYMPYKNMQIEEIYFTPTGIIMTGRRNEVNLNISSRDQFGIMFYSLDVSGSYIENRVFMSGGLDKVDIERIGLPLDCKIIPGEVSNQVIIGSANTGFRLLNIDPPSVVGKIKFI